MSQSVKLSDGSYIDTTGVYDATQSTTQQALNKKLARIGTTLYATPSAAGSWTPTAVGERTTNVVSITLPEGMWLLFGNFDDNVGYLSIIFDKTLGATYDVMGTHKGALSEIDSLMCVGISNGGRTVSMRLEAVTKATTHTWDTDGRRYGIKAICIG